MNASYDEGRRPTALSYSDTAKIIGDKAMAWNRVDMKKYEKNQDENGRGDQYAYDSLYRLRQVKEKMAVKRRIDLRAESARSFASRSKEFCSPASKKTPRPMTSSARGTISILRPFSRRPRARPSRRICGA